MKFWCNRGTVRRRPAFVFRGREQKPAFWKMQHPLQLIDPQPRYETAYRDFLADYQASGEKLIPFVLRFDCSDFSAYLEQLRGFSQGIDVPETFGPHSTFWLLAGNNQITGVINIRHRLTDAMRRIGGHIGYGVAPKFRGQGYATAMLALALEPARQLGIERALITCWKENEASAKVALHNGAVFDSEELIEGAWLQRYWVYTGA